MPPDTMVSRAGRAVRDSLTMGRRAALSLAVLALCTQGCVMSAMMPGLIEVPQIQARAVQFLGSDGRSATMRIEWVGYNPNPFALYATNLRAELWVNGRNVGTADATLSQVLPARRPLVVLVEVNVSRVAGAIAGPARIAQTYAAPSAPAGFDSASEAIPFRVDGVLSFRSRYGDVSVPWAFHGAAQSSVLMGW